MFEELRAKSPPGMAYALFRDGNDFAHVFVNFAADDANALTETDAFKAFTADIRTRCEAPPEQTRLSLNLVQAYGFEGAMAAA